MIFFPCRRRGHSCRSSRTVLANEATNNLLYRATSSLLPALLFSASLLISFFTSASAVYILLFSYIPILIATLFIPTSPLSVRVPWIPLSPGWRNLRPDCASMQPPARASLYCESSFRSVYINISTSFVFS